MPKKSPTADEKPNASASAQMGTKNPGQLGMSFAAIAPTAMPIAIPMMPPTSASVIASMTNCDRMWLRRAPTALRSPISRVRSVTDTSMMFMMPIPPTRSAIEHDAGDDVASRRSRTW